MAREMTTTFECQDGIITAGAIKIDCQVAEGRGADKVVFCDKLVHTLDFAGCKLEDIADRAAGGIVIDLQNNIWRPSRFACQSESGKSTKVAEFIARERQRLAPDPAKMLMNKVAKGDMSKDDLAALISQLQGMMK